MDVTRYRAKLSVFFTLAGELGTLSTCKRDGVGCVIIPTDFSRVHSIGYNGPPAGQDNDSCRNEQGNCGCIHAEANAVIKLGNVSDAMIITTRAPCEACAGLIINSRKISHLVWCAPYRTALGIELIDRSRIEHVFIQDILTHDNICKRWQAGH
jgi:deoxycytidylate deaminase